MKRYSFGGWAPLCVEIFIPINVNKEINWTDKITNMNQIKIYLDASKCKDSESKSYYKIYNSKKGFTVGRIFSLIFETYIQSIDDLYDGNENINSNLSLTYFEFDEKECIVHPHCD